MKQNLLHVLDDCNAEVRASLAHYPEHGPEWYYFSGQARLLEVLIATIGEGKYDE